MDTRQYLASLATGWPFFLPVMHSELRAINCDPSTTKATTDEAHGPPLDAGNVKRFAQQAAEISDVHRRSPTGRFRRQPVGQRPREVAMFTETTAGPTAEGGQADNASAGIWYPYGSR